MRDKISTIFPVRIIRPCVLAALCGVEPQGFYYGGTGESELGRRGDKAYGDPDYSSIDKPPKSLSEHGYSLTAVKEWRTRQSNDGLPSSFDDFLQEHSLCVECRATGITFQDRSARLCTVCGGSGRTERSEP